MAMSETGVGSDNLLNLREHCESHAFLMRQLFSKNNETLPLTVCVEEFVARYGYEFKTNGPLPKNVGKGIPKECFVNCTLIALANDQYIYCEGIAASHSLGFPIHHAWLADQDGNVVEPTWDYDPGECMYFGIPFTTEYMRKTIRRTEYYGMIAPNGMYNRNLFDETDPPECYIHPIFIDEVITK